MQKPTQTAGAMAGCLLVRAQWNAPHMAPALPLPRSILVLNDDGCCYALNLLCNIESEDSDSRWNINANGSNVSFYEVLGVAKRLQALDWDKKSSFLEMVGIISAGSLWVFNSYVMGE